VFGAPTHRAVPAVPRNRVSFRADEELCGSAYVLQIQVFRALNHFHFTFAFVSSSLIGTAIVQQRMAESESKPQQVQPTQTPSLISNFDIQNSIADLVS